MDANHSREANACGLLSLLLNRIRVSASEHASPAKVLTLLDEHFADFVDVRTRFVFSGSGSGRILYSGVMFARRISIQRIDASGAAHPCPIRQIDNFAMRNFTNDSVFDDTLPAADGLLEAGHRVPLDRLQTAMEDWFRRKGYLKRDERLDVREIETEALVVPKPGKPIPLEPVQ